MDSQISNNVLQEISGIGLTAYKKLSIISDLHKHLNIPNIMKQF